MAAWINALREEGTKQDCLNQAIKLWEENLKLRAALREIDYAVSDESRTWKMRLGAIGSIARAALEGK